MSQLNYRTVWLSDIHLGNRDCKADYLLNFLESIHCEKLYLVGDIIDMIAMRKRVFWPSSHNKILQKIKEMASNDTEVIYVPGNHDAMFREYHGQTLLNVKIRHRVIHQTPHGKKMLVVHGDELDHAVLYRKLHRVVGDAAYDSMVLMHRWVSNVRSLLGIPYWSLATYVKTHVKEARKVIEKYENAAIKLAEAEGMDGIICGHIHKPEILERGGILYCNDGDWTESCTALTETREGVMKLIHWSEVSNTLKVKEPLLKAA